MGKGEGKLIVGVEGNRLVCRSNRRFKRFNSDSMDSLSNWLDRPVWSDLVQILKPWYLLLKRRLDNILAI